MARVLSLEPHALFAKLEAELIHHEGCPPAMPKSDKQVDIRSASFRVLHDTPGHTTYGVWINGGKCGDLTIRQEEVVGFEEMMRRGGFTWTVGAAGFLETRD
jgi:hypothetical protein